MTQPNLAPPSSSLVSDGSFSIQVQACTFEVPANATAKREGRPQFFEGYRLQVFRDGKPQLPTTAVFLAPTSAPGEATAAAMAQEALEEARAVEQLRERFKDSLLPVAHREDVDRPWVGTPLDYRVIKRSEEIAPPLSIHVQPCLFTIQSEIPSFMQGGPFEPFVGYRLQILQNGKRQLPLADVFLAPLPNSQGAVQDLAGEAEEEARIVAQVRDHFKAARLPVNIAEVAMRVRLDLGGVMEE